MSAYIRPRICGASVFFTVNLAARGSDLLVREIAVLREAVRLTRAERPIGVDAWVVMPDHLHCVWILPQGDAEYPVRWREIKTRFTKSVGLVGRRSASKIAKGEKSIWQRRFWDKAREQTIRGTVCSAELAKSTFEISGILTIMCGIVG